MEDKTIFIQENFIKRLFDVVFSAAVLILHAPLFLLISLAIFFCSPGTIVYTQVRLGRNGKPFKFYKFRTMHLNADQRLKDILEKDPLLRAEWEKNQKLKVDPRVFPLGNFLRKTSMDELPQFWNVLKGDLSVVGPRPYMVKQRRELGHLAHKILSVRPGVTGLWQTSGRSNTTFQERIMLDAKYVDMRSFGYDLLLIIKTFPEILSINNAC